MRARLWGAAIAVAAVTALRVDAQSTPVAGQDVPIPKRIHCTAPAYPDIARQARVEGLVVLEVTIDVDGRPSAVRVLRGVPLLDAAAKAAITAAEYAPTLVDGTPTPVLLVEFVDFFTSDARRAETYCAIAKEAQTYNTATRLRAISRLGRLPRSEHTAVQATLEELLGDGDEAIRRAATRILAKARPD